MRRALLLKVLVSALLYGAAIAAIAFAGDRTFLAWDNWLFATIVLLPALVLSWRAAAAYAVTAASLAGLAHFVNDAKIALTDMPLTWLDLRIAAGNPAGFLGAVKASPQVVAAVASALLIAAIFAIGWRLRRLDWTVARANAPMRALAILISAALAATSLGQFSRRLETAILGHEYAEIANMPDGLVLISKLVGPLPFLVLTARYDASSSSPFRDLASMDSAMAATEAAPAPPYLLASPSPGERPDIVIVLLESTFDLPKVFETNPPMTSPLFPDSQNGQLQGELNVNAIGGGTWISEFEAITGIPSRLFGYAGYYTHVELGPYVKASLATYLKARGYQSLALYPVEGRFYGARAAYAHYGFDRFVDGEDLKIDKPWYAEDTDIVAKYIDVIDRTDKTKPLLAFALTMENHSPHPCTRFGSEKEMPYRFAGESNARGTCELNEYIARYRSTEAAIAMLEQALRKRQAETGRPYVLAMFGDHQPNSFTGTGHMPLWSPNDYSALRRAPNDVTFYQIRSSAPSPFATKTLDTSVVMLPTLVSAYVAKNGRDMYLPANFAIQARCGEKIALPRLNAAYGKDAMIPKGQANSDTTQASLTQTCRSALVAARPDYLKLIDMP